MKANVSLMCMLTAMLAPAAFGRLGETADRCTERYGRDCIERPASNFWAFERVYVISNIEVTIRFLTMSRGEQKAGWVCYKPVKRARNKLTDEMAQSLLHTVPGDWEELVVTSAPRGALQPRVGTSRVGKETDAQQVSSREQAAAEARNERIKAQIAEIEAVVGSRGKCWINENAYASFGKDGLILFSNEYLKRYDRWAEAEAKRKERESTRPPPGF